MQGNVDHKSGIELRFLKSSTCIEDGLPSNRNDKDTLILFVSMNVCKQLLVLINKKCLL